MVTGGRLWRNSAGLWRSSKRQEPYIGLSNSPDSSSSAFFVSGYGRNNMTNPAEQSPGPDPQTRGDYQPEDSTQKEPVIELPQPRDEQAEHRRVAGSRHRMPSSSHCSSVSSESLYRTIIYTTSQVIAKWTIPVSRNSLCLCAWSRHIASNPAPHGGPPGFCAEERAVKIPP